MTRARTENMNCMLVTLDVSKYSGWLNVNAPCRVERSAMRRDEVRARRREERWATETQGSYTEDESNRTLWAREARRKHVVHVYDAGRVETQRLVEHIRRLPSRKGCYETRGEVRARKREGRGAKAARAVCSPNCKLGAYYGTRGRTANMLFMLATLDVSRLSGWLNTNVNCLVKGVL